MGENGWCVNHCIWHWYLVVLVPFLGIISHPIPSGVGVFFGTPASNTPMVYKVALLFSSALIRYFFLWNVDFFDCRFYLRSTFLDFDFLCKTHTASTVVFRPQCAHKSHTLEAQSCHSEFWNLFSHIHQQGVEFSIFWNCQPQWLLTWVFLEQQIHLMLILSICSHNF